ncbi:ECF RNA polymerase sigma factor SigK [Enhygromyxa salina]|uniref:ECF RNA polymerase sigma factor SigK n=1 Tax=Enhygromyxa salina TaxID=215803 RepID=A0A2S9Y872_9BACT|nr:sigma-70 family RNA polymerase sigma factor [Enhygromyxa salina]PRQ01310.1 ECF RNA polymerase sigma factor SigK [Enhygromyxa salina]
MNERIQPLDHELLAEAASGGVDAYAALYDRYAPLMLGVARQMLRDPAAAEDLVHDVFIEAWRHADSYASQRGTVRTWLLVRLRSRAMDRLRAEQLRRRKREPGMGMGQAQADDPQRVPDQRLVIAALERLDPRQRESIELAYFEGLSAREIAERTHAPIGTVKSRIAAGLLHLRRMLGVAGGVAKDATEAGVQPGGAA